MNSALTYEWRRITSTLSTWILTTLVILFGIGMAALSLAVGNNADPARNAMSALTSPVTLGGFLVAVLGAQALGQEYRFGTIRSTLALYPNRPPIFIAKLAVTLVFTLATALLASTLCVLVVVLAGRDLTLDGGVVPMAIRGLLVLFGWVLFGFGVAGITRNTVLGIVLPLVAAFVVEPTLRIALGSRLPWLGDVLPFSNALGALTTSSSAWADLGVFGLWALAAVAGAYLSFTRRDA